MGVFRTIGKIDRAYHAVYCKAGGVRHGNAAIASRCRDCRAWYAQQSAQRQWKADAAKIRAGEIAKRNWLRENMEKPTDNDADKVEEYLGLAFHWEYLDHEEYERRMFSDEVEFDDLPKSLKRIDVEELKEPVFFKTSAMMVAVGLATIGLLFYWQYVLAFLILFGLFIKFAKK